MLEKNFLVVRTPQIPEKTKAIVLLTSLISILILILKKNHKVHDKS